MSFFDIILIQPIFNILIVIYGILPGHDFGITLILFTALVRILMWPLIKKQLHQTKLMRKLQPELAKIKQRAKGNKQMESQLMMELYKEKGVSPFSSIGTLILQLPIFIALYAVINLVMTDHANIQKYTYNFLEGIPGIQEAITGEINHTLFGIVDLTKHMFNEGVLYWPILIIALLSAGVQYYQSKMLMPQPKEKKKLKDLLKDQAAGKAVDQSEISANMTSKIAWLFPVMTFFICTYLSGALVLYLFATNAIAVLQQYIALREDETDLEKISDKTKKRVKKAVEAEVVENKPKKKNRR